MCNILKLLIILKITNINKFDSVTKVLDGAIVNTNNNLLDQ